MVKKLIIFLIAAGVFLAGAYLMYLLVPEVLYRWMGISVLGLIILFMYRHSLKKQNLEYLAGRAKK